MDWITFLGNGILFVAMWSVIAVVCGGLYYLIWGRNIAKRKAKEGDD